MNKQIKQLAEQAGYNPAWSTKADREEYLDIEKFAELIVKACADAADMASPTSFIRHVGDYIGEQLGYGEEHGITAWRIGVEK